MFAAQYASLCYKLYCQLLDLFSFLSYWRTSHNISWLLQFHRGYKFFWHKTKQKISLLIWLKSWRNDEVVETRLHFKSYHDFTFIPMLYCPKLFLIIILNTKFLPKTLFWVPLNLVDVKTWKKSFCIVILSFFLGHCLIQHIHQNIVNFDYWLICLMLTILIQVLGLCVIQPIGQDVLNLAKKEIWALTYG